MLLIMNLKKKHNIRTFRDRTRSDSEKGDIEKKGKKYFFADISK